MYKKIFFVITIVLLLITKGMADGPPVDSSGNITSKHYVLKLTAEQKKEVGSIRILTLNTEQMKIVKKNPIFPKKIFILTPTWNCCTCDIPVYGIWNKPDQVAIPDYLVDGYKNYIEFFNNYSVSYDLSKEEREIVLDIDGKIFNLGKEINLEKVTDIINKFSKDKENNYITIHQPPMKDSKTQKYIEGLLDKIDKLCSAKNVGLDKH